MNQNIEDTICLAAKGYEQGKTMTELSREFGIPEETLRRKMKAHGIVMRPRGQPFGKHLPNGGKTTDKHGYILVKAPLDHPYKNKNGYIREHRLLMEKHLGRYLDPAEVIHHINGVKSDNRIENLQLYGSHSEHFRDEMLGNDYGKAHKGKPRAHCRRTEEEMLQSIRDLAAKLGHPPMRNQLVPPYVSWSVLNKNFGTWKWAVKQALDPQPSSCPSDPIPEASSTDVVP